MLAAAGTRLQLCLPIAIAVTVLLTIVTISYQQTITPIQAAEGPTLLHVIIWAKSRLKQPVRHCLLITFYWRGGCIVRCSQIVSAYPFLLPIEWRSPSHGCYHHDCQSARVKESGTIFAIPTYFFLVTAFFVVVQASFVILWNTWSRPGSTPMEMIHAAQPLTFFLILRALLVAPLHSQE